MRVWISESEHYPVYALDEPEMIGGELTCPGAYPLDVSDELVSRWRNVLAAYASLQNVLKEAHRQALKNDQTQRGENFRAMLRQEFGTLLDEM